MSIFSASRTCAVRRRAPSPRPRRCSARLRSSMPSSVDGSRSGARSNTGRLWTSIKSSSRHRSNHHRETRTREALLGRLHQTFESDVGRAGIARARRRGHLAKFGGPRAVCGGVQECNLARAGCEAWRVGGHAPAWRTWHLPLALGFGRLADCALSVRVPPVRGSGTR